MNHKRGRPKSTRAGCLFCKPHKRQGVSKARRYPRETARFRSDEEWARTDPYDASIA